MGWKRRLIELAVAGGTLGMTTGCPTMFVHNACGDPCCLEPQGNACQVETANEEQCTNLGLDNSYDPLTGQCQFPDGGTELMDLPVPGADGGS